MKKKNLVWGLFRQVQNERMTAFFSNNFTEERWRKAALKNAYALLGKQRFDHAVAFFLLAGSLKGNDLIYNSEDQSRWMFSKIFKNMWLKVKRQRAREKGFNQRPREGDCNFLIFCLK